VLLEDCLPDMMMKVCLRDVGLELGVFCCGLDWRRWMRNQNISRERQREYIARTKHTAIAQLQSGEDKTLAPPIVHAAFIVGSPVRKDPIVHAQSGK
jgi:hypothetical protein